MKLKRRTKIIIFIIIVLIGGLYVRGKYNESKIKAEEEQKMMHSVQKGHIKVDVRVTASSKLVDEQNLSFAREGKITKVNIKVGDEIKAGDILAELDMNEYENAIQTSRLELANAKLGLAKLLNNDTSLREAQIRTQISDTKSSYELEIEQETLLKDQLTLSLEQKKDQLEQLLRAFNLAKKNLAITEASLESDIGVEKEQSQDTQVARKQTIDSVINSLQTSLGDIEQIVESVDKIFGVSEDFKGEDDDYENFLGVRDNILKNKTEENIRKSYSLINKYTKEFEKINSGMSDNEIYIIIQDYYKESLIIVEVCDNALDSIDMSIESVGNLSSATIEGFKSIVSASRTSAISKRTTLENLSSSINSLLTDAYKEDQLKLSIDQIKLNYEQQKTTLQAQQENILLLAKEIENSKLDNVNTLNKKKQQNNSLLETTLLLNQELEDLLDGPDIYDIKGQQNLIGQSELRLERTQDQLDDYQIVAEFNGRVRSVDIVLGEQYELEDRKFIVVENPNLIELELQVNQIDIVKINVGNPALVTFDAYPNKPIEAKITSRNVNPEPNGRGGIYYETIILLEKQDNEILAGMSALVTITTAEVNDVVFVPTLSLKEKDNKHYVYIKVGDTYKLREVEVGIMNNFSVEIKKGLNVGDIIRASVLDDEALKEMGIDDSGSIFGK